MISEQETQLDTEEYIVEEKPIWYSIYNSM